jgi:HAMP domain-containing protein
LVRKKEDNYKIAIKAGVPFVLFSILAVWVVSNSLDGRIKEMEVAKGKTSKSIRQALMEEEQQEMMQRLNKIVAQDFDNTKRIKRPHEILEERQREREMRNAWHRRLYRAVFGEKTEDDKK